MISKSSSCWVVSEGASVVPGKDGFKVDLLSFLNFWLKMVGREGLRERIFAGCTPALFSCGSGMVGSTSNLMGGGGKGKGEEEEHRKESKMHH